MLRMNCNNMISVLWFRLLDIIKYHCIGRELSIYHVCMWHVFNLLSTACSGIIRALLGFTEGLFTVLHCSWQCYNEALTCTQALSAERYGWWSIWSSSLAIDCVSNTSLNSPWDLIMHAINTVCSGIMLAGSDIFSIYIKKNNHTIKIIHKNKNHRFVHMYFSRFCTWQVFQSQR